jgi:phosphoribosylanthranilate isomerase
MSGRLLTQIYEVSSPAEAAAISAIGVDHIGVLAGDGRFPRELPLEAVREIAAAIRPPAKLSALFLTHDMDFVEKWAGVLRPAIIHLGAAPELLAPAQIAPLRSRVPSVLIMRSVPVCDEESITLAKSYEDVVDFLLLDSHRVGDRQVGALGVVHDWRISRRIVELVRTPVILAGGLGPDNVADAIRMVRPAGVDSKTRTDREGTHSKDLELVRRFHTIARASSPDPNEERRTTPIRLDKTGFRD